MIIEILAAIGAVTILSKVIDIAMGKRRVKFDVVGATGRKWEIETRIPQAQIDDMASAGITPWFTVAKVPEWLPARFIRIWSILTRPFI